jgi:TonB family protein
VQLRVRWHQQHMTIIYLRPARKSLAALCCLLLGGSGTAWGQKGENVYAAPGMPVVMGRRVPVVIPGANALPPWLSDPLPRFWKNTDSLARQQDFRKLRQALSQRLHYPRAALRSQLEGTVKVRMLLTPAGAPLSISILKTAFMPATADKKLSEEMEAEALRVAQLLRFQPVASAVDTLTFSVVYGLW